MSKSGDKRHREASGIVLDEGAADGSGGELLPMAEDHEGGAAAHPSEIGSLALQPWACASKRTVRPAAEQRPWIACELTSIQALLRRVTAHVNRGLASLFGQHTFVGVVDRRYVLVQHLTKLYVVHLGVASHEFFYQQALRRWGNLSTIRLAEPVPLTNLYLLGLALAGNGDESSGGGRGGVPAVTFDAAPSEEATAAAEAAAALLTDKSEMLQEYLAIEIDDGCLVTIPQLVDGYVPPLNGLPAFVRRLVHEVDWTAEQSCFEGLARQLGALYRVDHVGVPPKREVDGGEKDNTSSSLPENSAGYLLVAATSALHLHSTGRSPLSFSEARYLQDTLPDDEDYDDNDVKF